MKIQKTRPSKSADASPRAGRGTARKPQAGPDKRFMRIAVQDARRGFRRGDGGPFGAVVVIDGRIVGRGWNRVLVTRDPTAHAEIVAIRRACRRRRNYRLTDCDLYATLEPCAMCLGAIVQARLRKVLYGAADPKAGAVRSTMRFPFAKLNHRPEIEGGLLADDCGRLLKDFFADKRRRGPRGSRPPANDGLHRP